MVMSNAAGSNRVEYFVNAKGFMVFRPMREDFVAGVEGDIEWMRGVADYNDSRADTANAAFDSAFIASMRKG